MSMGALMRAAATTIVLIGVAISVSCSPRSEASRVLSSQLEAGVVARVGTSDIRSEHIAKIATAQNVSVDEAGREAIRDALFALGAVKEQLTETASIRSAIRASLARAVLAKIAADVSGAPPSDTEVEEATAGHFLELDRPEGFRVIHAVARIAAEADHAAKERVRSVAERVAKAVAGAVDAQDFEIRARGVDAGGIELRIESLDPVASDGRLLVPSGGGLVKPFAAAASQLVSPGDLSPVTETEFGYHVLMLLERTPAKRVPLDQRRTLLRDEIVASRARQATTSLLDRLRKEHAPEVERSAGALMQSLQVMTP